MSANSKLPLWTALSPCVVEQPERNSMKYKTSSADFSPVSERSFHERVSLFLMLASYPTLDNGSVQLPTRLVLLPVRPWSLRCGSRGFGCTWAGVPDPSRG